MNTISKSYINGLLADAAYRDVTPSMDRKQLIDEIDDRMTPTLAKYIADNFEVISAINTPDALGEGSGFDAVVWKGRAGTEFEGQVFVSTRGTEQDAGGQDFLADVDLALKDAARAQIVDMVNWWLRESAPAGTQVHQIKNVATPSCRSISKRKRPIAMHSRAAAVVWMGAGASKHPQPLSPSISKQHAAVRRRGHQSAAL